jgi:putative ABC transport system permease protein
MASLGTNTLIVVSGSPRAGGVQGNSGELPSLTLDDARAIAELLSVQASAPVANLRAQIIAAGKNVASSVTGSTATYFGAAGWEVDSGSAFAEQDVRTAAPVAVIGKTLAKNLYGDAEPVGKSLRIQRIPFTVIGTLKSKGQSFFGTDQDDVALIPITTAQRRLSGTAYPGTVSLINVTARAEAGTALAEQEINGLLRQRHRISNALGDDFSVRNISSIANMASMTSNILSVLLGAIAFIALLIGGIGIMNVMLVSVTERTREIGLRMAIGAPRSMVKLQFLLEAVMLSLAGSLIGIAVGIAAGWMLHMALGFTVIISVQSVALAFGVASATGMVFGYWPAQRAASLNPIDALRFQ